MQEQINIIQEDEIDLRELFKTIKKHIKKIIAFVFVVCALTLVYLVMTPNVYSSNVVLSPQGESAKVGGGLSSLAALAGVNLNSKSSGVDPFVMMQTTLSDYEFNKYMIEKYKLYEKIKNPQNLIYPFGLEFSSDSEDEEDVSKEEKIYRAIKSLKDVISISQDKKTNLISLKATLEDRFFAKELVDIYLKEIILHVKKNDMKEIDEQIKFYKTELNSVKDVALKEQLSKSLSGLLQKRVFSKSNEYYFVSKLSDSRVSYIKEKVKPKRALILVVSFVSSFILAVFLVFFLEFIRNEKE